MKYLLLIIVPFLLHGASFHTEQESEQNSLSVVKVFSHFLTPNSSKPWKAGSESSGTGSGVIVNGNLILTAAHVVTDITYIEVKKHANPKKFFANVKWIAHDADLALLEVEDESFFEGVVAKKLGTTPKRQEDVAVYGYPEGGDKISITQGIISRIEHTQYAHSYVELLTIQIDAAINPGNSGGPAFNKKGEIVGIAIQGLTGSNNIGYIAPVPIIKHFFDDIKDGKYDGFPSDGVFAQTMENKDLKSFYGMGSRTGVLVNEVLKNSSSDGYLRQEDIILEVDGIQVADDSTVDVQGLGRISANYIVAQHFVGDTLHMKILRNTEALLIDIPLKTTVDAMCKTHEKTQRYYIFGGFVFMPLTETNFATISDAPASFFNEFVNVSISETESKPKEIVFIRLMLEDKINAGYSVTNTIVRKINDEAVDSFEDLVQKIKSSKEKVKMTLESRRVVVLDKDKATEVEARILKRYRVKHAACLTQVQK